MSNSGVNTGFAKCFILFMAIVILLQGVIYLGLPIYGMIERDCKDQTADITGNPFKFAIDLIYFAQEECGAPSITISDKTVELPINWNDSFEITNRVYIVMIVYMAVSALWILTSLMVIVTLCCSVTKILLGLCYWPWFLSVIAGSILDAVAAGYFIHDIVHTTSAADTLQYIGAGQTPSEALTFLQSFDAYFITPALVMTLVSARVVLIWLLNICGTSFCLSLSNALAKRNEHHNKPGQQHRPVPAQVSGAPVQFEQQQQQQPMQQVQQYPPQTRPMPLALQIAPNTPQRQSSMPYNNSAQAERQSPMPYNNNQQPERLPYDAIQTQSPVMVYPVSATSPNESNELSRQPNAGGEVLTYRNTANHPDKLDYPPAQVQSPSPTPIEMRHASPQLSVASPLNNRYSTLETAPGSNQPQRVSEELRGQLPWSYTSMLGGKPQPPRKPQKIYPQIPEPDYTTHPGNVERPPATDGGDDAGQQTQPGYSRW